MWSDRFAWSGEVPLGFPALNPVALSRTNYAGGEVFSDGVNPARSWQVPGYVGSAHGVAADRWGQRLGLNVNDPAAEQGRLTLPHFAGLWPSSGKLLIGLWVYQSYSMTFNPLLSTRGGSSPLAYLSTYTTGRLRHQAYSAGGALILDQYEDAPWGSIPGDWQWVGQLVDLDAHTSQLAAVNLALNQSFLGPVRAMSGTPNEASTADLDVFSLQTGSYWTGGGLDEVLVAHPGAGFDFAAFVGAITRGSWARGADPNAAGKLTVTESGVTASAAHTLITGAEPVAWDRDPIITGAPSGAVPFVSTDGAAWSSTIPSSFTGLMRWEIPMTSGQQFTGIDVQAPVTEPPTLNAISPVTLAQNEQATRQLVFTIDGPAVWSVASPVVQVVRDGSTLTITAGYTIGVSTVTVTLTDEYGRTAVQSFQVTVEAAPYAPAAPPSYPHSPIVVSGEDGPEAVLIDPLDAIVTKELNGAQSVEFTLPRAHRVAGLLQNERGVQVAGETYRIRRMTASRQNRAPVELVYAEAGFYDLATAGQIDAREWTQASAGEVMTEAVRGTGWTVAVANVSSLRTYETDDTNPLALLREVQKQHGGDLLFDNEARTVSLVTQSGRDQGVAFFYGHGLSESKRVVDTTSLVTRIYARNADGLTIAAVNGGRDYVEDFSFTDEVRTAVYDFEAGTSAFTMLSMVNATLAARSKPDYSYEVTVSDASATNGQPVDAFEVGDRVTVVDHELGIRETQRIVKLEYDVVKPWQSKLTLSGKLRELGSSETVDAGVLTTGSTVSTFDLVPYNLLLNGRFDNGLAHWAHLGAEVVEGKGTGDWAVRFEGTGQRWVEQTVVPDNRNAYAVSLDVDSRGPSGFVPDVRVEALVTYEDGSTETIELDLQ